MCYLIGLLSIQGCQENPFLSLIDTNNFKRNTINKYLFLTEKRLDSLTIATLPLYLSFKSPEFPCSIPACQFRSPKIVHRKKCIADIEEFVLRERKNFTNRKNFSVIYPTVLGRYNLTNITCHYELLVLLQLLRKHCISKSSNNYPYKAKR